MTGTYVYHYFFYLMVCFADSEADAAEKEAIWQRMIRCEQLKSFTSNDIQTEFEKQVLWWTEDGETIARIKSLAELGKAKKMYECDDRMMLMAIFEQVAKASGGISDLERTVLKVIREKLDVDYPLN